MKASLKMDSRKQSDFTTNSYFDLSSSELPTSNKKEYSHYSQNRTGSHNHVKARPPIASSSILYPATNTEKHSKTLISDTDYIGEGLHATLNVPAKNTINNSTINVSTLDNDISHALLNKTSGGNMH